MTSDATSIVFLGGLNEVGLNSTLLVHGSDALLVDCGSLLSVADAPGVDRVLPDVGAIFRDGRRLLGIVLTHAHEDHLGAIPYLLSEIEGKDPIAVYGTPLALLFLRAKMEDGGMAENVSLVPVSFRSPFSVGPFRVELVRVTHSVPESAAVVIESPAGRILHTGDFKLDPTPMDGQPTDVDRLRDIALAGVDVMLSDSTNAERPGRSLSEREVGLELERIACETEGRVVVACFASHLHRIEGVMRAAKASRRTVALWGRALHRSFAIAQKTSRLDADAMLVSEPPRLLRHRTMLVVTGAQGEPHATLSRLGALLDAKRLAFGDRVVISATTIPGNELAVRKVINTLAQTGVDVVLDRMRPVHCSGHAHQDEQADMLALIRPRFFVPIHGDRAMLAAHARTAIAAGMAPSSVFVVQDGETLVLERGSVVRGPSERVGRRAIDSASGMEVSWAAVTMRRRLSMSGIVTCAIPIDATTGAPRGRAMVLAHGTHELDAATCTRLADAAHAACAQGAEAVRAALLNEVRRCLGVRPVVEVHLVPIDA